MNDFFPALLISDYIAIFSIFATTLLSSLAVIYGRKSYFVSLKNFENDKDMFRKAEFYIREFMSVDRKKKINPFLKKIASDDLNGGVEIPTFLTDALIKSHADYYFYLVKSLKSTWKFFKVCDDKIVCIYTGLDLLKKAGLFGLVYIVSGSLSLFFISNFSWYWTVFTSANKVNTFFTLILLITTLVVITMISLVILMRFMTIWDMSKVIKRLKNS